MNEQEAHLNWCRQLFASLAENGVWTVPRSGLTFTRRGDTLVLTDRMDYLPPRVLLATAEGFDIPPTAADWREYQDEDFDTIRKQFALAGITVIGEGISVG